VTKVKISFAEKRGWVIIDESVANQQLLDAVSAAGPYKAEVKERSAVK